MSLQTDFPETKDCMELQTQVEKLLVKKDYLARNFLESELAEVTPFLASKKALMVTLECDKKNVGTKGAMIDYYLNKYTAVDKDRIEPDSKAKARQRVIIGGAILIVSLGLLIQVTSKK